MLNEQLRRNYGAIEDNPVRTGYHDIEREDMNWEDLKRSDHIELERIRLVTDSGCPIFDISYVHLIVNGEHVNVTGTFPKQCLGRRTYKAELYQLAKEQGIYIKNLFDPLLISKLY